MTESNADKQRRGINAKQVLRYTLDLAKNLEYITDVHPDYKIGMPGYSDQNQFKTHYLITFDDNSKWIIFNTTSVRDRIKEQYWEAHNFKTLDHTITRAYLVYPDSISDEERAKATAKHRKINNRGEYSTLDGVVSQGKLFSLIEEYALRDKSPAQIRDIRGRNFEARVAAILSNPWNLNKLHTEDATIDGLHFDIFEQIAPELGLGNENLISINATSSNEDIGMLPSGGFPKTDVLATLEYADGSTEYRTISCKRTSEDYVSVHQYTADTFASVLDSENEILKNLLNEFQRCGGLRELGDENCIALTDALAPYEEQLCMWVLGGFGGEGTAQQCADFIMTYNNSTYRTSIHTTFDYYCNLLASDVTGHFGTPFRWTYPSGRKGQTIQLKTKIL